MAKSPLSMPPGGQTVVLRPIVVSINGLVVKPVPVQRMSSSTPVTIPGLSRQPTQVQLPPLRGVSPGTIITLTYNADFLLGTEQVTPTLPPVLPVSVVVRMTLLPNLTIV